MRNPNNKLGIKTLTDEQLRASLPNWEMIDYRLNSIREEAEGVDLEAIEKEPFEALKYDQFFSILGGRGAGKTSVIYTLYEKYKKNGGNIVLPIIMPELFEDGEGVLDWLFEAIDFKMYEIEELISRSNLRTGEDERFGEMCEKYAFFSRCVFNKENKLRRYYRELKDAYYTKNYPFKAESYVETREWKSRSVKNSFSLMKRFVSFWNKLVEVYSSYINSSDNRNVITPLIYVFIDDADLRPQIINELIYVLQKYLSHPNLVVFLNASQKILKYTVKNYMFNAITKNQFDLTALMNTEYNYNGKSEYFFSDKGSEEIVRFRDLRYGKEYDKIERLTDEILRKILPVNNRFYLKKYERYIDKSLLIKVSNVEGKEINTSLEDAVYEILQRFYSRVMELHNGNIGRIRYKNNWNDVDSEDNKEPSDDTIKDKKNNFKLIHMDEDNKNERLGSRFYLAFFAIYPRDMLAVYHALEELLEELYTALQELYDDVQSDDKRYDWSTGDFPNAFITKIRDVLVSFLESVISSNRSLRMFSRYETDMIKTQLLHWQLFVDYEKVLEVFSEREYVDENREHPEAFFEMLCMLDFIEQLIVLLMPQRRKTHGLDYFKKLLSAAGVRVIKNTNDLLSMFDQFYMFKSLNLIPKFDIERLEHQVHFLKGTEELHLTPLEDEKESSKVGTQEGTKEDMKKGTNKGTKKCKKVGTGKEVKKNAEDGVKEDRRWNELYMNVLFHRYDLMSRLKKYSNEIEVLPNIEYAVQEYKELRTEYYLRVKSFFYDNEVQKDPMSAEYDPRTFRSKIKELMESLNNMEMKITEPKRFEFVRKAQLESTSDRIKLRLSWFVDVIFNQKRFTLNDLEYQLTRLKDEVSGGGSSRLSPYENTMTIYNRLEFYLRKGNLVVEREKKDESFSKLVGEIKDQMDEYLHYYYRRIRDKIIKENRDNLNRYDSMKKQLSEEYNTVRNKYWIEYREQVDGKRE